MQLVTFKFPTPEHAKEFLVWLCESGEQQYWEWCEVNPPSVDSFKYDFAGHFVEGFLHEDR